MIKYNSKYIKISQNNSNQYEMEIENGDYSFKEFDIIKVDNENYHLKTYRIGQVYTKDNGSIDATLSVKDYHFKKSDVVNFSINPTKNNIQLSINLKDQIIKLVNIKNEENFDENISRIALIIMNGQL